MRPPLDCYAVCPPGVEELTAAELAALGIRHGRADRGGVAFRATNRQLYAANLWLRTATRVVVRVASFGASSFGALEQRADEIAWPTWLGPDAVAGFRVTATASKLYHTDAIAERLARAADAAAGGPGPRRRARERPEPTQLFVVRARNDRFTVSVDASGVSLYKRGWRQEVAKAPLRESLAAALLLALGWDGTTPLVDPFCGSGTIPIEAALLARNLPPGYQRDFAFFDWPSFEPGTWASVIGAAAEAERDVAVAIVGADRDAGAVDAARANAERAGVADEVELRHASVSDLAPPSGATPGWLVSNPPYGERLNAGGDLRNLYARLGTVVRERFAGWHVGLLVADRRLAAHSGLRLGPVLQADNGGIPTELLADRSAGGTLRRPADH
jgi:putative N6-adenine-specific DNA methylase